MEERLRFVARLLDGEAMSDVCREFGISRNTRLHRSGAENLATPRQPLRPEVVTYVLGTDCHLCLQSEQYLEWRRRWAANVYLYQLVIL